MACISFEHIKYLLEQLDTKSSYKYINPTTHGVLKVKGFIGDSFFYTSSGNKRTVSHINLDRIIPNIYELVPFSIDALVNASGNWRSGFESLLAYTSEFYTCKISKQKHLVWIPEEKHTIGEIGIWTKIEELRSLASEEALQHSSLSITLAQDLTLSIDEIADVLNDLFKRETKELASIIFGLKFQPYISSYGIEAILNRVNSENAITKEAIKAEILKGIQLHAAIVEGKYGLKHNEIDLIANSNENAKRSDYLSNSQECHSAKKKIMKYEDWNYAIKNYFFGTDSSNDIYLSIDKDSFIDYIKRIGLLDDEIEKIQNHQRMRGVVPQSSEEYIWVSFIRLFRTEKTDKASFFNRMTERITMCDSKDKLYMLFPYFALFTMPLANQPDLHASNFYSRLREFLIENGLIKDSDKIGTTDMASLIPPLKKLWLTLEEWAQNNGYKYQLKYQFSDKNEYVAPFLAECLFTATRKEKFKMIFYKAGLAPENDLTNAEIKQILNRYHREIDFDDVKWKDAIEKYGNLIVSTFRKEYAKWDGTAITINKQGNIKRQEYSGTRQALIMQVSPFRGHYEFNLLASIPDASFAEEFDYESELYGNYSFIIDNKDSLADVPIWNDSIANAINIGTTIAFNRVDQSQVELIFKPQECELLSVNKLGFLSCKKIIAGGKYLVLLKKEVYEKYSNWLNENDASEIERHDLSESYRLFTIACMKKDLKDNEIDKFHFQSNISVNLVNTLTIPTEVNEIGIYKGLDAFFNITGINITLDKPKAVFNSEGRVEEVELDFIEACGLWALHKVTHRFTLGKSFQIFCNNEKISGNNYRLIDFKVLQLDEYAELSFNQFGEYAPLGDFKGLNISVSNDVNYGELTKRMMTEGNIKPFSSGEYSYADYLLYAISSRPKCNKYDLESMINTLQFNGKIEVNRENRWAVLDMINNYFRMGYINYVYTKGEHLIAVNKPTLILLPPKIRKEYINSLKVIKQTENYWTAILTGARTPQLMEELIKRTANSKLFSIEVRPSSDGIMPETIFIKADNLDDIQNLASNLGITFFKSIYSNALLNQIASIIEYQDHVMLKESEDYYDDIRNFEVVDYKTLAASGKYKKVHSFSKGKAIATYFPSSFRNQTIMWIDEKQYKVDKYWGHLLGMRFDDAKIVKYNENNSTICLPQVLQLPLLYARALTMVTGEIPKVKNFERSYHICENPYTLSVNIDYILNKIGQ